MLNQGMALIAAFPAFELGEVDGCLEGGVEGAVGAVMVGAAASDADAVLAFVAFGGMVEFVDVLWRDPGRAVRVRAVDTVASGDGPFGCAAFVSLLHLAVDVREYVFGGDGVETAFCRPVGFGFEGGAAKGQKT
jgi:hypothetical protein